MVEVHAVAGPSLGRGVGEVAHGAKGQWPVPLVVQGSESAMSGMLLGPGPADE